MGEAYIYRELESLLETTTESIENATDEQSFHVYYPRGANIAAGVSAIVFMVLGIIGNLINIIALGRNKKLMENIATWFLLNLGVSDLVFCIACLPFLASRYLNEGWVHGDIWCHIYPYFLFASLPTSTMNLALLTINRYVLFVHHKWYSKVFTSRTVAGMIAFIWLLLYGLGLLPLAKVWGRFGFEEETDWCTILEKDGKSPKKFLYIFFFILPCLVIVFCYTWIFIYARRSRKRVEKLGGRHVGRGSEESHLKISKEDLQMTKMILIIFLVYLASFLPMTVITMTNLTTMVPVSVPIASIFVWSSTCSNLLIYALCNPPYWEAYKSLYIYCRKSIVSFVDLVSCVLGWDNNQCNIP